MGRSGRVTGAEVTPAGAGPAGSLRWASPALAALVTTVTVVGTVLLARPAEPTVPPLPLRPGPADRVALSLDRCRAALELAGRDGDFPDRSTWRPVAGLPVGAGPPGTVATVLDAPPLGQDDPPFVCVTGPTTVEVSDPAAAVPVAGATLLLTAPSGIVAASGPGVVAVHPAGSPQVGAARWSVGYAPDGVGRDVVVVHDGTAAAPRRPAPPALAVTDRREIPADRSAEALSLLERCRLGGSDRFWVSAVVLPGDATTGSVLVVAAAAAVGGCTISPDGRTTPLVAWRIGQASDGPRPFAWLSAPPGTAADIAAGPVQARVTRLEITAPDGTAWVAVLGGSAFVTRVPAGVDPDPRTLTVRASNADGTVLWTGPAAD